MKFTDIPNIYKAVVAIIAATVFMVGYHDRFITIAEAAEQQQKARDEVRLLRVDGYETEKRALVREKSKAVKDNNTADAETLEQDIQTLRDKIKGLCDQLEDC